MKATRIALAFASTLLLGGVAAAQASYTAVPDGFRATGITDDGETVVGTHNPGGSLQGFLWDWKVDPSPTSIGGGRPVDVSADGTVVLGTMVDPDLPAGAGTGDDVAGIWTQATGWQSLGFLPAALSCPSRSNGVGLSADGTVAAVLSWQGCSARSAYWTAASGLVELEHMGTGSNGARGISADGTMIVGFADAPSRSPAYWYFNGTDYTGVQVDPTREGELLGSNADGTYLYGTMAFPGDSYYSAFTYQVATGTVTKLGSANFGWAARARGVNGAFLPNGKKLFGEDYIGLGRDGWIWTQDDGIVRLNDLMAAAGVSGVPALGGALAITPDGTTAVGYTDFVGAWILELPTTAESLVYSGCGGNPAGSISVLSGAPTLGTTMTVGLHNPLGSQGPGSLTRLTFSIGSLANPCGLNLPGYGMAFNGAVGELLISLPKMITIAGPSWNGVSPAAVPVPIPTAAPLLGVTIYAQGALVDVPGGVHIGLTEAIRMTFGG